MAKLSEAEMASQYGFALAFLKSDPSLKKLFQAAVSGNWTPDKFVAKLKGTSWYKKNGENVRQWTLLKTSDPATYAQKQSALRAQVNDQASALGASLTSKSLGTITENAMKFGWNDSQIRDVLAGYVKEYHGVYRGQAGADVETMRSTLYKNGIKISKNTEQEWAQQISKGNQSVDFYQRQIRKMAKSLAPGFAQELDAGMDLQDIASPFIEAKAKILEVDPATVDLFDKDIRGALSSKGQDGKPATKSLWQFENDMRQDPKWLKTSNAQDSVMSAGKKVLQDFGFVGVS